MLFWDYSPKIGYVRPRVSKVKSAPTAKVDSFFCDTCSVYCCKQDRVNRKNAKQRLMHYEGTK